MTADAVDGPYDGLGPRPTGLGGILRSAAGSIPPAGLVLLSIFSVQLGGGFAKDLFSSLPPSAVVFLRIAFGALILTIFARPRLKGLTRRDLAAAAGFGLTLAMMNLSFYEALARLPMGIAVSIEFLGPLTIAVAASRRRLDLLWVGLAAVGVALMAPWGESGSASWIGIGFALLAGVFWAGYILMSAAVGSRFSGASGLSLAMLVAMVVIAPVGIGTGGGDLLQPELLLIGLAVGLLSSVIPYTLELNALRRMPKHVFGILMSLEPAAAALVGLVVLGEILGVQQWAAIICIVGASLGATRTSSPAVSGPAASEPAGS